MEVKFNHVTGDIEVFNSEPDKVFTNFISRLGFRPKYKDCYRIPFSYTVNGICAFSIFWMRYRKEITFSGVFPDWAKPVKLTRAQLEQGLGQDKDKLVYKDNQLQLKVATDTSRNWSAWLTGEYDASKFRNFMYKTGWSYNEMTWYIKPTPQWLKMYWPKMKFTDFVKVDDQVKAVVQQMLNHQELAESAFREAKKEMIRLAANPPSGTYSLFPHQAEWLTNLSERNSILAFDMGLGKTLSACYWALAYHNTTELDCVFVIAPKSVKSSWASYFAQTAFEDIIVIISSWAAIPEPPMGQKYIVIADESHYTQDPESQRTQKFLDIAKYSLATLMLSGTPAKNGTCRDIFTQLQVCGLPTAVNKAVYASRYGWQEEMRLKRLSSDAGHYIHFRHKDEVLDLPEKMRIQYEVELSPKYRKLYEQRYAEYMANYNRRVQEGLVSGEVQNLVELGGLRLAAALGKVEGVAELTKDILNQGSQVAVFFDFREAIELLATHLKDWKVAELKASDSEAVRAQKIKDFQAGEYDVFLTTFKCGGVGVELTPCDYIILGDRPWTPGDAVQAEDRAHRIGQKSTLNVYWVYWDDPDKTEKMVDDVLHLKQDNINELVGSNVTLS